MNGTEYNFFVAGGTLKPDVPSYVRRQADDNLYESLKQGHLCYVLTSRQMGKSSLMVRTAGRLREEGVVVASIDLTSIGQNLTCEQWYEGLLYHTGQQLELEDEIEDFLQARPRLGPLQKWMVTITDLILRVRKSPIVIFIDEIDSVRSLSFSTDEFFAGIRELYNRRSVNPELCRLTFCLLGVATPPDLIKDTRTTPFNIGTRIELNDFTESEAAILARGLDQDEQAGSRLLRRILFWTGGHPYLTQRMCRAITLEKKDHTAGEIDRVCESLFLSETARERDDNLIFVRDRMLRSNGDLPKLLDLYHRTRKGSVVRDSENNPLINILKLSGIVHVVEGKLEVRNRIYSKVFDLEWVRANLPEAELERQRRVYRRRIANLVIFFVAALAILSLMLYSVYNSRESAIASEKKAMKLLYASQMYSVREAWEQNNIERADHLLNELMPNGKGEDPRGFEWFYYRKLCHTDLATFKAAGPVSSVAFSPNGSLLAAGSEDGSIRLWSVTARRETLSIKGHNSLVGSLAFLSDNKTLVSASDDKAVKLWNVETGELEATMWDNRQPVIRTIIVESEGLSISGGEDDGSIVVHDLRSRRMIRGFKVNIPPLRSMAYCDRAGTLALGNNNGSVELWSIGNRRKIGALSFGPADTSAIKSLACSADGKVLAAGNDSGRLRLFSLPEGVEIKTAADQAVNSPILTLAFSPARKQVAIGYENGIFQLLDLASGKFSQPIRGNTRAVRSLAYNGAGGIVATGNKNGEVKLWDISGYNRDIGYSGTSLDIPFNQGTYSLAFSPDGRLIAAAGEESVNIWNLGRGPEATEQLNPAPNLVRSVEFTPDGSRLATAGWDGKVFLFDTKNFQGRAIIENADELHAMAISKDGKFLAAGGASGNLKLWDLRGDRPLPDIPRYKGTIQALAFSPASDRLASVDYEKIVRILDAGSRKFVFEKPFPVQKINSMVYSPDGKVLALACSDGTIQFVDAANPGNSYREIKAHNSEVWRIGFSPDGKRLVTGGSDGSIKFWDLDSFHEVAMVNYALSDPVTSIAFSADGKKLAAGVIGRYIRLLLTD